MALAHRLDCAAITAECRFIVQSEDVDEAVAVARHHLRDAHGREYTTEELRSAHLKIV